MVVSRGDGVWGPAIDAIEVLRLPADRNETTFGLVRDVALRPDGGVLVFDAKGIEGRVLRAFDAEGRLEYNVGRSGSGPGEFGSEALRITVQPDGTILVHEGGRVVSRFAADGVFLNQFPVLQRSGRIELLRGADNSFYTPMTLRPAVGSSSRSTRSAPARDPVDRNAAVGTTMFRYDTTGTVIDSIVFTDKWLPSGEPYSFVTPSQTWFPLPDGRVVVSRTDMLGFLLVDPSGRSNPLIGQVPVTPVAYLDEERAEWDATLGSKDPHIVTEGASRVPTHKLPAGAASVDTEGRIWIRKHVKSEKVSPYCTRVYDGRCGASNTYRDRPVYIAFDLTGRYLGEVRFPLSTNFIRFAGRHAWAITLGEDDEQLLVKYRIR